MPCRPPCAHGLDAVAAVHCWSSAWSVVSGGVEGEAVRHGDEDGCLLTPRVGVPRGPTGRALEHRATVMELVRALARAPQTPWLAGLTDLGHRHGALLCPSPSRGTAQLRAKTQGHSDSLPLGAVMSASAWFFKDGPGGWGRFSLWCWYVSIAALPFGLYA
jgi:hypothetical protein